MIIFIVLALGLITYNSADKVPAKTSKEIYHERLETRE
jgi:hypothetical protein